jgi:hypothetical protein
MNVPAPADARRPVRLPAVADLPPSARPPFPLIHIPSYLQSLSYVSPQALLNALLPQPGAATAVAGADGDRVASFKRYIAGEALGYL